MNKSNWFSYLLLKAGDNKASLEIVNLYFVDYMSSKFRSLKCITDGSFSNEILEMLENAYMYLVVSLILEKKNKLL